jgi:hypothetical protein
MVKIKKEEKPVVAYTSTYKVTGNMFVPPGGRLSDFLSATEQKKFIPIANAVVKEISGREICRAMFIELNRDEIIFLVPASELEKKRGGRINV